MKKHISSLFALVTGLAFVIGATDPTLAEDFYKGKTVRFVVGASAGGGYDTYTRIVARHISKHIPGNPATLVVNMPGKGSLIAANYTYNKADPDGLTIGVWASGFVLRQALRDSGVKIDGRKVGWIGTPSKGSPTCAIMGFTGLKTLDNVIQSKKPLKIGGTRGGSTLHDVPVLMNNLVGTKFDVISGYSGTPAVRVALQKREIEGACWGWESMKVTARSMLEVEGEGQLIPYITYRRLKDPEVKDLPLFSEVITGKEKLATYETWAASYEFQRPFSVPPGTPPERLKILRDAFAATLKDPELLAEAKKARLGIEPVSGKEIEGYVKKILSAPAEVKQNLSFLMRKPKKRN